MGVGTEDPLNCMCALAGGGGADRYSYCTGKGNAACACALAGVGASDGRVPCPNKGIAGNAVPLKYLIYF